MGPRSGQELKRKLEAVLRASGMTMLARQLASADRDSLLIYPQRRSSRCLSNLDKLSRFVKRLVALAGLLTRPRIRCESIAIRWASESERTT